MPRKRARPDAGGPGKPIPERFAEFDAANPEFYELYIQYARELRAAGHKRGSSDAICHRIRWHTLFKPVGKEPFKVTNDYTAHYARKLVRDYPEEFEGFFTFRPIPSDADWGPPDTPAADPPEEPPDDDPPAWADGRLF